MSSKFYRAQGVRLDPTRPSVIHVGGGMWQARAYDGDKFLCVTKQGLSDAFDVASRFAAGDYSEAL